MESAKFIPPTNSLPPAVELETKSILNTARIDFYTRSSRFVSQFLKSEYKIAFSVTKDA
jgi:hypothetical protein